MLLVALAATAVASPSWAGAPKPLVTDARGDARVLGADFDITSATITTTGVTKRAGSKVVYTPTSLVASVTVAGTPSRQPGSTVTFYAATSACDSGELVWTWRPGNLALGEGELLVDGCGSSSTATGGAFEFIGVDVSVSGRTLSWKSRLKDFQGDLPLGSTFTAFRVYTDQNEPVTNYYGTGIGHDEDLGDVGISLDELLTDTAVDTARSSATYVLR